MTRQLHKLSARAAATLSKVGRHSDGGGLYLSIAGDGRRRWVFMFKRNGKVSELGLGSARDVSLADARALATAYRKVIADGKDPLAVKRQKEMPAIEIPKFGEVADRFVDEMAPQFRNEKHIAQWRMTLRVYAEPLRDRSIDVIDTDLVVSVLKPIWQKLPETASRLRGRIERILDFARVKGWRTGENPARWRGHLDKLLPKRQKLTRGHHAAMPYENVPAFVRELRTRDAVGAFALEFTILTAARTGEVLGAKWSEFDLEKKVWTIPANRMKAAREHRVPLTPRLAEILKALTEIAEGEFVFPGVNPKKQISGMSMTMVLRRMKREDVTVHGFRSAFRDWAAECTPFPNEVCEAALAHTIQNRTEAAYRRGDLFEKRRQLMELWATFCAEGQRDPKTAFGS